MMVAPFATPAFELARTTYTSNTYSFGEQSDIFS